MLYLAGCRVLGLLNKLLTAPLWRATESEGHILDMCDTYSQVNSFLNECICDQSKVIQFAHGELSCFSEDIITKDDVFCSVTQHDEHDDIVYNMLHHTFIALQHLISRVTKEYQSGGQYSNLKNDASFRRETASAPKHNKRPERIFGCLDFLLQKRPNVNTITNEAQIMFIFNQTANYIDNLPKEEFDEILHKITSSRNDIVEKAKERESEKNEILMKKQKEKQEKIEQQRANEYKRREELATTIIDASLWQNRYGTASRH